MKKIIYVWVIGAAINILLMWFLIYADFFENSLLLPLLWIGINFIPVSLVIGYFHSIKTTLAAKNIVVILVVFLVLCVLSIYSRNFISTYEGFIKVIKLSPYFLLPIQIFIIFSFLRVANLKMKLIKYFKSENRDAVIGFIQNGKIIKALDKLLEESKSTNESVFTYLSHQKSILKKAMNEANGNLISKEDLDIARSKVTKSLLEFITPQNN